MRNLLFRSLAALTLFAVLSAIAMVPSTGAATGDELVLGADSSANLLAVGEVERNREVEEAEETAEETIGLAVF